MTINPHIMKAIAEQRIADLHREAAPRPEAKPDAKQTRRLGQSTKRRQAISTVRAEQR